MFISQIMEIMMLLPIWVASVWLVIETLIQKRLLKNGDTLGFLQNLQGGEVLFKGNKAFAHDSLLIFLKFGSLIAEPNLKSEQQKYWFSKLVTDVLQENTSCSFTHY